MELQVFNNDLFGEVRFVGVDGKPYAVANDILKALGYAEGNWRTTLSRKCNKEGVAKCNVHTNGGIQQVNCINEGNIYRLIIGSKLPSAEKFERWVFDEVLPQIRQTGGYIPTSQEDTDAEIMAKALLIAQKTIENKNKLIEELKPKAEKYTTIYNSDNLYKTTDVAKDLGMSATKLNKILNEKEIIFKKGTTWYFYSKYEHMIPEYADYIINEYGQQLRWTNKGRDFIIDLLNK